MLSVAVPSTLVTGSSGFIGGHVCALLAGRDVHGLRGLDLLPPPPGARYAFTGTDIRRLEDLRMLSKSARPQAVLHLAAKAEVVFPFSELADLMDTNVSGTAHVLEALGPRRFVFASSSAVYGNGGPDPVPADGSRLRPIGSYGMSKMAGELVCQEWAREHGGSALGFRLGNVVGRGCRGLIPYLVGHALRFPDGSRPAGIRGGGRLIRDYVPVRHTSQVLVEALRAPAAEGTLTVFNVGTGTGRTNGEVAELVRAILERHGLRLRIEADAPALPGEAREIVLEAGDTFRRFGVAVPGDADVRAAIEEAVLGFLRPGGGPPPGP